MKSCLRAFVVALVLQIVGAEVSAQCNPAPIINFVNPSFEGPLQPHVTPSPWSVCMPGTTPDTEPGSWGVTLPPTNGGSYLGLVHQPSTGWQEAAAEQLATPFVAGTPYIFTIDVANIATSDPGVGILPGCAELQIWGGFGPCDDNTGTGVLLWSSGDITPFDTWITKTVSFTPTQNFTWVMFRVNSLGCSDGPYIVVDNIGSVTPIPLGAIPTTIGATCFGFNTGSAYISYSGGLAPYSYLWSNGVTTPNNSNLFAGTYGVTITDANQCTASASVVITQPDDILATVAVVDATCGTANGSATANVTSGTGPFSYLWDNGGTTQTISNLAAGTYTVTITGAGGCTNNTTIPISGTVGSTGGLSFAGTGTDATCGQDNGSASIRVTAGTGPFTYLWSTQDTIPTINDLAAGTYDVTVTGAGGCSASGSVQVNAAVGVTLTTSATDATCGNSNGTASVSVLTGTPPLAIEWSNQQTTPTITNLAAGTYDVTVTDADGCSATGSATVNSTVAVSITVSATNATCGSNNGRASVNVITGAQPVTYLWSNQATTQVISNLAPGTYDVTVTGADGCSATGSATVLPSSVLSLAPIAGNSPCSFNGATASVDVTAGTGPFRYVWSTQDSTQTITGLVSGTYNVTVTGLGGCSATTSVQVSAGDTVPPVPVCQDITVTLGPGVITVNPAEVNNGSSDNCGIASITVDPSTFDCADLGPHTVTLTVTDSSGNVATCNSTVTVVDTTAPVAVCQDVTIILSGDSASITVADIENGSTDNCSVVQRDLSQTNFDCTHLGVNVVTLTVLDPAGNSGECNANVTVEDNTPPVAVCQDITVSLNGSSASITAADVDGGSTDNCAIVSRTISVDAFDCSNLGQNATTLTVSDATGNSSTCDATVTVEDNTPPLAVCQDITISLVGTSATITAADIDNGSTDNCAIVSRTVAPDVFDCSNIGSNTTTLTVTDASGNSSDCNATVTIGGTGPVAACKDITVSLIGGSVSIVAADVDGGSSTDCGTISLSVSPDAFDCSNVGPNNATLSVTDIFGSLVTCVAVVTVIDDTPPVAICQDATVTLAATTASVTPADVDNNSTDNCAIVSRTVVPDLFDCSNLGSNTVTFTAIDASGNSASCTAAVTVTDAIAPAAVCQDISKSLTGSSASITAAEIDNGSTDNCAIVSRTVSPASFDCSNIGANAVTFTATDASGNASSCNATVTISDDTPPVALAKDITVSLIGGSVGITAADVDNGSFDNCGIVSRTVVPDLFTCANLGANVVTLTVEDQSGLTASAICTVTVVDDTPPLAICKNISVTLVNSTASIIPEDVDDASTDNCTIVSRTVVPNTFTCATLGVNNVTFTATDQSGNSSSCNAEVTVLGAAPFSCSITSVLAPSNQITGGNNTTIYIGYGPQSTTLSTTVSGQGQFTYSWTPATGLSCTDCLSPVFTPTAGGNYTFTLTVTSSSGCSSTCEITICVLDIRADSDCGGGNSNNGKVMVCHVPQGNPGNMHVICIGVAAVPAHIPFHGGDRLGRCDMSCGSGKLEGEDIPELFGDHNGAGFETLIYPNPFSSQFQVKVESESTERIDLRMFNVTGQLVISQNGIQRNEDLQLGSQLANGFYFLEIQQGGFKKVIRLVKGK